MHRLALHWQILIAVIVAATCGLVLNRYLSKRQSTTQLGDAKGERVLYVSDSSDKIEIKLEEKGKPTQTWVVDPTGKTEGSYTALSILEKKAPIAYELFTTYGRSTARWVGDWGDKIGQLFLRMLRMVSVPLIITSLMTGILGLASAGKLRKLFGLTIGYYVTTSMLAIVVGLFLVNTIRPGRPQTDKIMAASATDDVAPDLGETLYGQLEKMIPTNPIEAVSGGDFLSIIAFTIAFGIFTILVGGKPLELFRDLFQAGFDVMMTMTMAIIHIAPIGVFGLMLSVTATQGIEVFQTMGLYMITVFSALALHGVVTLPLIVYFVARRNPWRYAHAMSPALMTAFSSASSNATLPLTLNCVETRAGVDNRVSSFVLPLGATINMDGTALFEVIAVLFIVQLEPAMSLTITQQVMVAVTALLASIGAAGIPHAGLVMMVIVLQAVGFRPEQVADKVALILAVDRILDMCRTAVNVWSDSCGCAVVARFEEADLQPSPQNQPARLAAFGADAPTDKQPASSEKTGTTVLKERQPQKAD